MKLATAKNKKPLEITMSEKKMPSNDELLEMIKKLNEKSVTETTQASGWNKPAASVQTDIKSVSVPISLEVDGGKIRVYLSLPGDVANSPESLMAAIEGLEKKGLPLDIWRNKSGAWDKKKRW
jgi:hypothetical protein